MNLTDANPAWTQTFVLNRAGFRGGEWVDYPMPATPGREAHWKISFFVAGVFDNVAYIIGCGFVHIPEPLALGPLCSECSSKTNLPCAMLNAERLAAHAQADGLQASNSKASAFERLTNMKWLGAFHAQSDERVIDGVAMKATFPEGFYAFAYDYDGTCVSDGSNAQNVGKKMWEVLANTPVNGRDLNAKFIDTAEKGGGWMPFDTDASYIGYVVKMQKWGSSFYIVVSFSNVRAEAKTDCVANYAEPCS